MTIEMFEQRLDANLSAAGGDAASGTYRPQAIRRDWIPKPGREQRPLGIPTVRDRVVQTALRQVLEPIFERDFAEHSYGFRPRRGCKDALRRVESCCDAGYRWVVDADLKSYFDTIPHEPLLERVADEGQRTAGCWSWSSVPAAGSHGRPGDSGRPRTGRRKAR